jgi:hypothetical protein
LPSVKGEKICNIGKFFECQAEKSTRVRKIKEGFLRLSKGAQQKNQNFLSFALKRPINLPQKQPESIQRIIGRQRS